MTGYPQPAHRDHTRSHPTGSPNDGKNCCRMGKGRNATPSALIYRKGAGMRGRSTFPVQATGKTA
jgi:hypothetical protein